MSRAKRILESVSADEFDNHWRDGRILLPVKVLRDEYFLSRTEGVQRRVRGIPQGTLAGVSAAPHSDMTALKAAIENGIKNPIALDIDDSGKLIINDGTHRLLAAEELGIMEVPVQFVSRACDNPAAYDLVLKHGRLT